MSGERLIEICRSSPSDTEEQIRVGSKIIAEDHDLNFAAQDCYAAVCMALGQQMDSNFLAKFQRSWAEFSVNALSNILPIRPACPLSLAHLPTIEAPTLSLLWHFPEYPLLMQRFMRDRVFSIVGDDAAWTTPLVKQGLAGNFRSSGGLLKLKGALRSRQSIAAAVDYCHASTRSLPVPFMGQVCDTPAGIIGYGLAKDYRLQVITARHGEAFAIALDPTHCRDVATVLQIANTIVADEILCDPSRWLMWPSLATRALRAAQRAIPLNAA